ncbi:hypothetical protein FORMB_17240 [Formosa sp. Hel1_33_131]|nr:hypothetical protein FORMB_17240 [Formosa sp. Hel1_33_131]
MDNNEEVTLIISALTGLVCYLWLRLQCYKQENKQFKKDYQEK